MGGLGYLTANSTASEICFVGKMTPQNDCWPFRPKPLISRWPSLLVVMEKS